MTLDVDYFAHSSNYKFEFVISRKYKFEFAISTHLL